MALEYYTGIDHFLSYLSDPTARIYLQQSLDFWRKKDFTSAYTRLVQVKNVIIHDNTLLNIIKELQILLLRAQYS